MVDAHQTHEQTVGILIEPRGGCRRHGFIPQTLPCQEVCKGHCPLNVGARGHLLSEPLHQRVRRPDRVGHVLAECIGAAESLKAILIGYILQQFGAVERGQTPQLHLGFVLRVHVECDKLHTELATSPEDGCVSLEWPVPSPLPVGSSKQLLLVHPHREVIIQHWLELLLNGFKANRQRLPDGVQAAEKCSLQQVISTVWMVLS
mmetsp:Transcript_8339/g.13997  ORF Transcript_8339/g.13997 Transcript_8339/m.13997 type:complete len:204 (-) Transcript_8339:327-938(-)